MKLLFFKIQLTSVVISLSLRIKLGAFLEIQKQEYVYYIHNSGYKKMIGIMTKDNCLSKLLYVSCNRFLFFIRSHILELLFIQFFLHSFIENDT